MTIPHWLQFDPLLAPMYQRQEERERDLLAAASLYDRARRICEQAEEEGRRPFYRNAEGHRGTELTFAERHEFFVVLGRARGLLKKHLPD